MNLPATVIIWNFCRDLVLILLVYLTLLSLVKLRFTPCIVYVFVLCF